jgi:hypothetical protein
LVATITSASSDRNIIELCRFAKRIYTWGWDQHGFVETTAEAHTSKAGRNIETNIANWDIPDGRLRSDICSALKSEYSLRRIRHFLEQCLHGSIV